MKLIHVDRNGNIIPDLSKGVWPEEVSRTVWETMNPGRKVKRKEKTENDSNTPTE